MRAFIETVDDVYFVHTKDFTYTHSEIAVKTNKGVLPIDEVPKDILNPILRHRHCNVKSTITFDNKRRDWVEVPVKADGRVVIEYDALKVSIKEDDD